MYCTDDYGAIHNSKDVAACLDYYWPEANICQPVKNWGHNHGDKKKCLGIIFKDASHIFPLARSIIVNDRIQISFDSFEGYAIPIPIPTLGGGAAATMFSTQFNNIATGMRDLSTSTHHDKQERERAKNIIDTTHRF